jgi:hypothetical protein
MRISLPGLTFSEDLSSCNVFMLFIVWLMLVVD